MGLNMLTKAVARCVAGVHESETSLTNPSRKAEAVAPRLRVDFMRALYIIDSQGSLWFSHAAEVLVQPASVVGEKRASTSHKSENKVLADSQLLAMELRSIFRRARTGGASIQECFSQFDPAKIGCALAGAGVHKIGGLVVLIICRRCHGTNTLPPSLLPCAPHDAIEISESTDFFGRGRLPVRDVAGICRLRLQPL